MTQALLMDFLIGGADGDVVVPMSRRACRGGRSIDVRPPPTPGRRARSGPGKMGLEAGSTSVVIGEPCCPCSRTRYKKGIVEPLAQSASSCACVESSF